VQLDSLRLGWTTPLRAGGLRLADVEPGGPPLLEVRSLSCSASLLELLLGRGPVDVVLEGAVVDASLEPSGVDARWERWAAAASTAAAAAAPARAAPPHRWSVADGAVPLSAELHAGRLTVSAATSCAVRVPADWADAAGGHVHLLAALGLAALQRLAAEGAWDGDGDMGWASPGAAPAAGAVPGRLAADGAGRCAARAEGWLLPRGRGVALRAPAALEAELTPAVAAALGRIHPALGGALRLDAGERLRATWAPERLALPAARSTLEVAPLRLALRPGQGLLDSLAAAAAVLPPRAGGLLRGGAGGAGGAAGAAALHLATTRIRRTTLAGDAAGGWTERFDLLLSASAEAAAAGRGLHLAAWSEPGGRATLGLPADALARLGVPPAALPEGAVLQLPLTGGGASDWADAARAIGRVGARAAAAALGLRGGGGKGAAVEGLAGAPPPPPRPFPWEVPPPPVS